MSSNAENKTKTTFFAPHLAIRYVRPAMDFYQKAFGATVLRKLENPDGSVHVAEMEILGALFHLHEEVPRDAQMSPETVKSTTMLIGLFTPDPDSLFRQAVDAGATPQNPMQDYDYGYRQGTLVDPFGHQWLIQRKI
jgi:PhnB protein